MLKTILKIIISLILCLIIMYFLVKNNQYNFISFIGGSVFGGINILVWEYKK